MTGLRTHLVALVHRTCRREHAALAVGPNQLWCECDRCGFVSPGIVLDSRAIVQAWRFDRQRLRFPRRRAS